MLTSLSGDRSVQSVCREYELTERLSYSWRDKLLENGHVALANPNTRTPEHDEIVEPKKAKFAALGRTLGRRTYELKVAGGTYSAVATHRIRQRPQTEFSLGPAGA